MNWKLIFLLSLFGLIMPFGAIFFIPSNIERIIWIIFYAISAIVIGKKCTSKYFLNGFLISIFIEIWLIIVLLLFFQTYMANHLSPEQILSNEKIHGYKKLLAATYPIKPGAIIENGIIYGLICGLFSFISGYYFKKKSSS